MSGGDILLSARDLSVRFGGVLAVNKVSFDVRRGEVFTLIGPNGAGKTTVFNLISRIYTPTSGQITWHGEAGGAVRVQLSRGAELNPPLFCSPSRALAWQALCPSPAARCRKTERRALPVLRPKTAQPRDHTASVPSGN